MSLWLCFGLVFTSSYLSHVQMLKVRGANPGGMGDESPKDFDPPIRICSHSSKIV